MKFLGLYAHEQGVLDQLVIITAAPDPAECIDHSTLTTPWSMQIFAALVTFCPVLKIT